MNRFRQVFLSIIIIFLFPLTGMADDLGWVKISQDSQIDIVTKILDHAYTKYGDNQFLVSINESQQKKLESSGIEFEILFPEADILSFYLLYPHHKPDNNYKKLSDFIDYTELDINLKIAELGLSKANSVMENTGYRAVPLETKNIYFNYSPMAVSNFSEEVLDFPTDALVNLLDVDSLYAYDTRLEAFETRYIYTDSIDAARDWIAQKFIDFGYTDVTTPSFWMEGKEHFNVMAVKLGYAEPDKVIVIGGHYDAITYGQPLGPYIFAPGADDNASGTTLTLELARVLADVPLRKTVIFMAFTAEEVGLVGSSVAAQDFAYLGTDIEVMFNYDMVAHDPYSYYEIDLHEDPYLPFYTYLTADAAYRVTSLDVVFYGMGGSSDHYSFYEQGFTIVNAIEEDFNDLGWHTELDLSSRMNFPYFLEVSKMALASLAVVANSASPTIIEAVIDQGDGQSLEIFWSDCNSEYTYTLYVRNNNGGLIQTINISSGSPCSYIVDGLSLGSTYKFSVVGEVEGGYPSVYSTEGTGIPYLIPRIPVNFLVGPDLNSIALNWEANLEADFSHYRIYRDDGSGYVLYQDNVSTNSYNDSSVEEFTLYRYKITSVDFDLYESAMTEEKEGISATFNKGVLIADEFGSGGPMPNPLQQLEYFDIVFGNVSFDIFEVLPGVNLNRSVAGQYSSIFWFDDDYDNNIIENSEDSIVWYCNYYNNILISGWRTIGFWTNLLILPPEHPLTQIFGVTGGYNSSIKDFVGAAGQNGWPSVVTDPASFLGSKVQYIYALTKTAEAEVIYTFDSFSDNPLYEGMPCGLLVDSPNGKRIILGFPLYYLTPLSAKRLIHHALILFNEKDIGSPGNIDGLLGLDIDDLVYFVDYAFRQGAEPVNLDDADVNGSCNVDIDDLIYLVDYTFGDPKGPAPVPGCVY